MAAPTDLLTRNHSWAQRQREQDPEFFSRLSQQQAPKYLWIGCSDSRVPATQIVDMMPGEIFVHRNVANVVVHADLNCLSAVQFAIDALRVEHIMVVGHYGCGGVQAVLQGARLGLVDNWLRHVADVAQKHAATLAALDDEATRLERLCELNAIEQAVNVCQTTMVRDAWERKQQLSVHAWVYGLQDGHMHDLGLDVSDPASLNDRYRAALARLDEKAR